MKKVLIFALTLSLLLIGCSASEESKTPQPTYNQTAEETVEETIDCYITGSFVATLRHLIPDYCLDGTTLTTAVVTLFQDGPIAIYVGEEIASEMTEGERYVFYVKDDTIRTISEEEFETGSIEGGVDVRDAMIMKNVRVESVRLAEEHEAGLDTCWLKYEKTEE